MFRTRERIICIKRERELAAVLEIQEGGWRERIWECGKAADRTLSGINVLAAYALDSV